MIRTSLIPRTLACLGLLLAAFTCLHAEEHAAAHPWWDAKWPSRKKLVIDAGTGGVQLQGDLRDAVLLLRLHDGNFNFLACKEDGSDLRFVSDDNKTVLPHHIEKWDGLLNEAYVWVKAPELKSGAATTLWMYTGNVTDAAATADAKGTFDEGTVAVFHFADAASLSRDSSASGLTIEGTTAAGPGNVGSGQRLTGTAPLTLQPAPQIEWTEGGSFTFSAWFKPAGAPEGVLFSRKEGGKSLSIGFSAGTPYVEVNGQRGSGAAAVSPGAWHHLALVVGSGKAALFVDGKADGTLSAALPALKTPVYLGGDGAGGRGPLGDLDEVRLAKAVRSEGAVLFDAVSQGPAAEAGKLVVIGQDELSEHAEEGELMKHLSLLVDISKDLTFDGWVVIVLCALLAVVGMVIAAGKFMYLNTIEKASKEFIKRWEKISSDLTALDSENEDSIKSMGGTVNAKSMKLMRKSPLYHIYHLGSEEIARRVTTVREITLDGTRRKETKGLSGRSIQAIKATMHGGLVREVQKLHSNLVFLTIGIAGGPYLGLLGTVIGVMITFAVIAKSGQVEVNSIAPGIAGALLATVAGLAVAIPCLFIYSYLSSRIKDVVTNMETFIDEFIAKMAEHHKEA